MFKRSLSPPPKKSTRERSGSGRSAEPLDSYAHSALHDAPLPLKRSETTGPTITSKKLSGNGFLRMARQASDNAFRSLNRKGSNNNLAPKKESQESSAVYQQNPRVYLYQQQQYQHDTNTSSRAQTHSDDNLVGDWTMNNNILQFEPPQLTTEKLRRNVSLPDMNAEYSKEAIDSTVARAASPVGILPGQATNRSRSGSRPRVQPHHFVTTAMSNEPITASSIEGDGDTLDQQKGTSTKEHDHRAGCADPQCEHLTKHQVLSEESLPGSLESRPLGGNKDLPPIPKGQTPAFQLCTRIRRKTDANDPEMLTSPVGVVSPVLPLTSETLKRKESKGLIPQDVLKNMDPKDVQKAIKDTIVTSRVYKVMTSEQLDALRKEQDELEQFIEAMNVTLHIESRMRDASHSLIRLHENNSNIDAVKAATTQLHASTRKMDQIVQKTQEAMWRLMSIQRILLQHEGAILNAGLRRLDNENRELSRTVMQLDSARDQEKEEKIKWKKEHNRLKFQSILFPCTPILEEFDAKASSDEDQLSQKHQAQLASMEQYVKELNDEIMQKDEKLLEAKEQLQAVKGWVDDFQASIQGRKQPSTENPPVDAKADLQAQLRDLQSTVEHELKDMDVQVTELKSKVDTLLQENNSLASKSKEDKRRDRSSSRRTHVRQGSDLQVVLRDSLMELDRQIRQDILQSASSSRPTSTSTSTTAFSVDTLNSLSRRTSNRSVGSPLSRSHSSRSSATGSSEPAQKENIRIDVGFQETVHVSSDEETPVEDASEEIQRLNTMVNEMREIVKRHSTVILDDQ